jgi:hypothetical protein
VNNLNLASGTKCVNPYTRDLFETDDERYRREARQWETRTYASLSPTEQLRWDAQTELGEIEDAYSLAWNLHYADEPDYADYRKIESDYVSALRALRQRYPGIEPEPILSSEEYWEQEHARLTAWQDEQRQRCGERLQREIDSWHADQDCRDTLTQAQRDLEDALPPPPEPPEDPPLTPDEIAKRDYHRSDWLRQRIYERFDRADDDLAWARAEILKGEWVAKFRHLWPHLQEPKPSPSPFPLPVGTAERLHRDWLAKEIERLRELRLAELAVEIHELRKAP